MNARGDIAGRIHDANGNDHGFLLHDGHFTQIDYPGTAATVGRGINNAGDVTGDHVDSAGIESGFILKNGTFYNVRVPHFSSTDVWMAEDNGRVMVGDAAMQPDGALHGYVRNQPGDFQLIDFPGVMLVITILAARWTVRRLTVPSSMPSARLDMGFVALGLLLLAEFTLVLWLRGMSIREYFASRDPIAGTVYYVMLTVFAVMPLLVARR